MATRASCNHSTFKATLVDVDGLRFKYFVIRCGLCGDLAGVTEYLNAGEKLHGIEQRLSAIERAIGLSH
jgi:hypothetical protein